MIESRIQFHRRVGKIFSRPLTFSYLLLIFLLIDFPYQYGFRYLTLPESLTYALIDAILYAALLFITTRLDLVRVTLCFLALPYLIFIPGWLNLPTAIILMAIFIFCLTRSLKATTPESENIILKNKNITLGDLLAFIAILVWVNLSGIGGYGFQWADYAINNARLHDLIVQAWPIRYGENRNFVYYFGFFLPPAIIGKLFSVDVAMRSVYVWAVLGITLVIRWLSYLSKWRFSFGLVIIFILFGPLDIINLFYIARHGTPLADLLDIFRNDDMDTLNFSTSYQMNNLLTRYNMNFFLGNYPSNSFQLYWSPQQLIAGWLCAGVMMHLFLQKQLHYILFVYALLCLWGPLVMIALLPFAVVIALIQLVNKPLQNTRAERLLSFENIVGCGSLICVFIIFYLGGSTTANPSFWLANVVDWRHKWDLIVVFYLSAWGIYALVLLPFILTCETKTRIWFACLVFALAVLPLRIFGEWSDLLCRGSAPLMFLLLVFFLRAVHYYWHAGQTLRAAALLCLLIPGTTSALLINSASNTNYGQTEEVKPLLSYKSIYPNFGPDDSMFNHWFRRTLPEQNIMRATTP